MFFKKKFIKLSRISKNSINLSNINLKFFDNFLIFSKFSQILTLKLNKLIFIKKKKNFLYIINKKKKFNALIGTFKKIINNIIFGFIHNYEKKIILFGVGYKFILQFNFLYLYLGFSHPIIYKIPFDIKIKLNSLTELIILGFNKQKVNQVAATIRNYRPSNPYKGNGIRYFNEIINLKIIKKK